MSAGERHHLLDGEGYRQSLRDGRRVFYRGELIEDVTAHPATSGGIDLLAESYDAQFDPDLQDVLTFVRPDGARVSKAWLIPRSRDDLRSRRACVEHLARRTFGIFGRQMDMIATTQIGMAANLELIRRHSPDYAENILPYIDYAAEGNLILAAPVADPQGWRSRGSALGRRGVPLFDETKAALVRDGELGLRRGDRVIPGALQVVRESDEGLWISGTKVVATVAPQGHEMVVSNIALPDPSPEGSLWALVPVGAEGVRLVCRETTAEPEASFHDHPIASRGDEADAVALFEEVFVPRWRVHSYRWTDIGKHYGDIGALEHWHTLTRICVKAELFVGLLQLITDGIGTSHRDGVRQLVAEVMEYASVLRGMVLASEERAEYTASGVLWPDKRMITAGRAYALGRYPHVVHIVKELAGQGPVLRWSEADFDNPEIGPWLEWAYEGAAISARDKNLLMNLLWDLTSGSHAGRVGLFENVNGFPVPYLRIRVYNEFDRAGAVEAIKDYLGLDASGEHR